MGHFDGSHFGGGHFDSPHFGRRRVRVESYPGLRVLDRGGFGTGPDPHGNDFPFVEPSREAERILADAWLSHNLETARAPLRVVWMHGFDRPLAGPNAPAYPSYYDDPWVRPAWIQPAWVAGSPNGPTYTATHDLDLAIWDADGRVVYNSTNAMSFRSYAVSPRLRAHEWDGPGGFLRLIQHVAFDDVEDLKMLPRVIRPLDARLDERCWQGPPQRLDAVGVFMQPPAATIGLELSEGYNLRMTTEDVSRGLRKVTRVVLEAVAGAGEGREPACAPEDLYIRSINGQEADAAGNFQLAADACYWARRPTTRHVAGSDLVSVPAEATLLLGNDCRPCCECEDYERVQKGVLNLWDIFEEIAGNARLAVTDFDQVIARWLAAKECRESVTVHLNALPNGRNIEVAAGICNTQGDCLRNVTLEVEVKTEPKVPFTVPRGSGTRTDGRGRVDAYTPEVAPNIVRVHWDVIPPRVSVSSRMRVAFPAPPLGKPRTEIACSLVVRAVTVDGPLSGTARRDLGIF